MKIRNVQKRYTKLEKYEMRKKNEKEKSEKKIIQSQKKNNTKRAK